MDTHRHSTEYAQPSQLNEHDVTHMIRSVLVLLLTATHAIREVRVSTV